MRDLGRQESRDIEGRRKESQVNRKSFKECEYESYESGGFFHEVIPFFLLYFIVRVGVILEFLILTE